MSTIDKTSSTQPAIPLQELGKKPSQQSNTDKKTRHVANKNLPNQSHRKNPFTQKDAFRFGVPKSAHRAAIFYAGVHKKYSN